MREICGHQGDIHYEVNKGLRQEFWSSSAVKIWRFKLLEDFHHEIYHLWKEFPNFSTHFH